MRAAVLVVLSESIAMPPSAVYKALLMEIEPDF